MKTSDGRTSIPSGELLSPPNKKPQQNRPSVGARGFEPLAPNLERKASDKHEPEAGRPSPDSELLALKSWYVHRGETLDPSGNPTVSLSPSERSEDANPCKHPILNVLTNGHSCSDCGADVVVPTTAFYHYDPPLLSLEDRLLVALSKRGDMSIGGFIDTAVHRYDGEWSVLSDFEDKDLVLACEQYASEVGE